MVIANPDIAGGGFTPVEAVALFMGVFGLALIWRGVDRWRNPRPDWPRGDTASNERAGGDGGAAAQSDCQPLPPAAPQHERSFDGSH